MGISQWDSGLEVMPEPSDSASFTTDCSIPALIYLATDAINSHFNITQLQLKPRIGSTKTIHLQIGVYRSSHVAMCVASLIVTKPYLFIHQIVNYRFITSRDLISTIK